MADSNLTTDRLTCPICTGPKQADEPECSVCRDEPRPAAYTAFKETDACARCGEGESWTVKGPDGLCIGQSWEGDEAECSAIETAEMLNAAYELGRNSNTTSAAAQVAGAKEVDRSTPTYTADNVDSKSVAAVDRSRACAMGGEHVGYYFCKKCGMDLTPDIPEQHGRYNDSPGAAR